MMQEFALPHLERERLLVGAGSRALAHNKSFMRATQPVLWIVAHGHVAHVSRFYEKVADFLGLPYVTQLPVKINDTGSLANKIGAEVQSTYGFFAYEDGNTLAIATPDPSQIEEMVANTLPFMPTRPAHIRIEIASPQTVRRALAESNYQASRELAESHLGKSKPLLSSATIFTPHSRYWLLGIGALTLGAFAAFPETVFVGTYVCINIGYFLLNPIKFAISLRGFAKTLARKPDTPKARLPKAHLPVYTILVPLKHEWNVIGKLVTHLKKLDYPKDKLDIKIITEVEDVRTREAAQRVLDLSSDHTPDSVMFDFIQVPQGELSTKPRSLNFALQFARGSMCVIYDAEDRPDLDQLKKAYDAFLNERLDTLCVQAKLNYYNSRQNVLTRFFTLEYSFWFDALLPGLQASNIPIPLGGTSNHFLTGTLRKIGTWDPYNVTEDADLGWRLSRLGYATAMIDSYTWEEANSEVWNWIRQRTRWQKGFLMTLLVHLRTPGRMWHELGPWGFFSSIVVFSTNFLLPIINPLLWIVFLWWSIALFMGANIPLPPLPNWLEIVGLVNLIFGNGVYILTHMLGAFKLKRYDLLPFALLLPFYWLLLSFASYRSLWQIATNPYAWEKTTHGLT